MSRYQQSQDFLKRAEKVIPLGSQTFSKSKVQFPGGVSPYFVTRAEGAYVWDIDGNKYVDFVNALLAVSLGYQNPDVDQAVQQQIKKGVIFSLPHPVETEVAEKIIEMVPCAEMVRFGKNGSDATSAAVRLARAFTKRDKIVVCGYHGWHDWYIGSTTRDLGVPQTVKNLTLKFAYNDLESLKELFIAHPKEIAAVIMEPMSFDYPSSGFLEGVKKVCHENGALLIFDETITGFRFAKGGAQELFGVTPDLATMGKGVSNGYPLSIVAGRREVMMLMEEVFVSGTFGGETLSLVAALAVIKKIQQYPVLEYIHRLGKQLIESVRDLIKRYHLQDVMEIKGHPAWSLLVFKDSAVTTALELKTLWMQEILQRGILSFGSHNLSYAHTEQELNVLLHVYQEVFVILQEAVASGTVLERLNCKPLKPLFKVR